MKTLVIYYSYSGTTRIHALEIAEKHNAEVYEVKDIKKPGKLKAYVIGSFKAMSGKKMPIEPTAIDLSLYENIIILTPIWASHPVPQIYNIFDMLPSDKKIEFYAVSASGASNKQKVEEIIKNKSCELVNYTDIKTR